MAGTSRTWVEELPSLAAEEADPERRAGAHAELAREAVGASLPTLTEADSRVPPDAEKAALVATRRLLRRRSWLMAGAIFTTLLPLSSAGNDDGLQFFLLRDAPVTAALSLAAATILWAAFRHVSRRLRVTGL